MSHTYVFDSMGPDRFENMVQALIQKEIGIDKVTVYGDGPDGQREAVIHGADLKTKYGRIIGKTFMQAKYKSAIGQEKNWSWLRGCLKDELERFAKKQKTEPEYLPDTWWFFTNLVLTPKKDTGLRDQAEKFVKEYESVIPRVVLYGYDDICRMLDSHRDIAITYFADITPGDIWMKWYQSFEKKREQQVDAGEFVYTCYCELDAGKVQPVLEELKRAGVKYYPVSLKGDESMDELRSFIQKSQLVLLFASEHTQGNDSYEFAEFQAKRQKKLFYIEAKERTSETEDGAPSKEGYIRKKELVKFLKEQYPVVVIPELYRKETCRKSAESYFRKCGMKYLEAPANGRWGYDGIVLWREKKRTVGPLYIQLKPGDASFQVTEDSETERLETIPFSSEVYVKRQVRKWSNLPGPVILFGCDTEGENPWWVNLKNPDNYDKGRLHLLGTAATAVGRETRGKLRALFFEETAVPAASEIDLTGKTLQMGLVNTSIKKVAHAYYQELGKKHIVCGISEIGDQIQFSRVGWRNMTRKGRRENLILQSFLLLPAVEEILKTAGSFKVISHTCDTDEDGNHVFYEKIEISAICRMENRAPFSVSLLLTRKKVYDVSIQKIKEVKLWFYNIYEKKEALVRN